MRELRARCKNGIWQLSLCDPSTPYDRVRSNAAMVRGRESAIALFKQLDTPSNVWQFELAKAAIGEGEMAIGHAELLADACANGADNSIGIVAPHTWLSARSAAHGLCARGLKVRGCRTNLLRDQAFFIASASLASLCLLADLVRFGRDGGRIPENGGYLFAIHGEWTNRTRHLLSLLEEGAAPEAIITLGRPRTNLASVRQRWETELGIGLPPMRRPLSFVAALRAAPKALRSLAKGFSALDQCQYLPPFREQVAIAYRVMYGALSAQWWQEQRSSAHTIFYGHTGTADTAGLENAQQAGGAKTVHVVHGISSGLNFLAHSNSAAFRCGHDAEWHRSLGGYGSCSTRVAPRPKLRQGQHGLLLLTNLAHPMNLWFRTASIRDETQALEDVAAVSKSKLSMTTPLYWKPHPATSSLPPPVQAELYQHATALGFQRQDASSDFLEQASEARWVVCTVSTVVIDLLNHGCLPIMLQSQELDPLAALAQYPLRVSNRDELARAFERLESPELRQAIFESAWEAIQPAAPYGLDQLNQELAAD